MARAHLVVVAALALAGCSTSPAASPMDPSPTERSPSTDQPTESPSDQPSEQPSKRPTEQPTEQPTKQLSDRPDGAEMPPFTSEVTSITPALQRRMRWSHRAGCPVPLDDLRHLRLSYVGFDGQPRTGELVVHEEVADDVVSVFGRLYAARWPVARMRLVDAYRGDDDRSMAANNTSAYNCRRVAGSTSWSEHAFGKAIDINPVQNPYVQSGSVDPPEGRRYADVDRSPGASASPGVIREGDVVVRAFAEVGWAWGGHWSSSKDYQHFSLSGR